MEAALESVVNRYAADASALGKGTRRELLRVIDGIGEVRRCVEADAALFVANMFDTDDAAKRAQPRLVELLKAGGGLSWDDLSEQLHAEGFRDKAGHAYKKARLVSLAISASRSRYAVGTPATGDGEPRLFDLLNLPREVGGAGGLAPIVRRCYDGAPCYQMRWRFAEASDLLAAHVVDDDADLPPESAAEEG